MLKMKLVSSLEKCFYNSDIGAMRAVNRISALKNQRVSLQLVYTEANLDGSSRTLAKCGISGALADCASVRIVEMIPSSLPAYPGRNDSGYITKEPGLFPDLLRPFEEGEYAVISKNVARSLWISFDLGNKYDAGEYETVISLVSPEGAELGKASVVITVIDAELPEQNFKATQWFHCDCIASYYDIPVFSEKHWEYIENFARVAVKNGLNTILTPVFTPPLDTAVGGERPTVQLVDVKLKNGKYTFGFKRLDRWIEMCNRVGMKYFEISHFFTQWGAAHAPKIIVNVNGLGEKRIFGWDTPAEGEEYANFLRSFLVAFIKHMKARGDDRRCIFHISDEPHVDMLEQYKKSSKNILDLLEDYDVMDALSSYDFFKEGAVKSPVVCIDHIEPFLENGVKTAWAYYCCSQAVGVSNRFFAMPGARTRYMGVQMYYTDVAGFLQWGFNFYYSQHSRNKLNPYLDSTGGGWVPSGDTYSVYPGKDGECLESMRIIQFCEGLEDMRALRLCEELYGRKRVIKEIEDSFGKVKYTKCITESSEMLAFREKINALIAKKAAKKAKEQA